MKLNKKIIPILFLSFVNVLGFTVLIPVLPFVVTDLGGTAATYGALIAMYPLFQFLGAPLLGSLSDKYGRRPVLLISQAGTLASWFVLAASYFVPHTMLFGFPLPLYIIALARVVDGITGGNISVANAYMADVTKPEERTKAYGVMGGIVGIGLMVGPAIGGFGNSFSIGYLGTCLLAIAISTVTLILMYLRLPESLAKKDRDHELEIKLMKEINIWNKLQKYKDNRFIFRLLFIRFFLAFSFSLYVSVIVLYMIGVLGLDSRQVGLVYLVLGVFLIINQSFIVQMVAKKYGDFKTFTAGQILLGASMVMLVFVKSVWIYFPIAYLVNLSFSLTMPTFKSLITRSVDKRQQGEVTGLEESLVAATGAIAPFIAGNLYDRIQAGSFAFFASVLVLPYIILAVRRKLLYAHSASPLKV